MTRNIRIETGGDFTVQDFVGRDKITNTIINYNYYPSQDLQISYLPPTIQYQLIDHKNQLRQALDGLKARKSVLLWGIGGVGKTNLAAHVAYAVSKKFKGGVIWLQVGNGDLFALCDGLARALGDDSVPRLPISEKVDAARRLLAGRRALLVLDDVREQKTLKAISGLCPPTIGLLVTSRQNTAAFRSRIELKSLPHPQARLLFCQRADLPKSMAKEPAVDAICRKWGGYPLGIILTAGRKTTEGLPLDRLAEHLRQVRLAGDKPGYTPPEVNEVHALLEDHFQPLAPTDLSLLNLIAANFGKSISLGILAQTAQLPELETETLVGNLVKAALVTPVEGRYSIHDVVRDAVLARLPLIEIDRLRLIISRSLEELLTQKIAFEGRWCIVHPTVWRKLEPEFENCLGAVHWSLENLHTKLAWNLFRLIDYPLGNLGYWDQEMQVCKEIIAKAGDIDPNQTAWWKAHVIGFTHWERDESSEAMRLTEEALKGFVELNDTQGVAEVQLLKANIFTYELRKPEVKKSPNYEEQVAETRSLFEQAMTTFEAHHDLRNLAHAFGDFTDYWYFLLKRYDMALTYCQRAIEIYAQLDDEEGWIMQQPPLCDVYIGLQEYDLAEAMLEPMRKAARKLGRPDFEPQVDWSEADLRERQGDGLAKTSKRKALFYYRQGLKTASRCRKSFIQVGLPYETKELTAQEQRIKRKIKKLLG